tara:strand:- start:4610 stop:5122 length:513 start_codon:yes stop_codon:yes gene_type:complete
VIVEVERQYLEIKNINELSESKIPNNNCKIFLVDPPDFQLNKFFYKQIGRKYRWVERLTWEDKKWINYVTNPNVETYILKEKDELVGYFEIIFHKESSESEIAFFGILEDFFGKKYGGFLLSNALKKSLISGSKRVWVHTCSLDHKNALKNYKSRGMKIFKTEIIKINSN